MSLTEENSKKLDKINNYLDILFNSFKNGIQKKIYLLEKNTLIFTLILIIFV